MGGNFSAVSIWKFPFGVLLNLDCDTLELQGSNPYDNNERAFHACYVSDVRYLNVHSISNARRITQYFYQQDVRTQELKPRKELWLDYGIVVIFSNLEIS